MDLEGAIAFAAMAHAGQVDKAGQPYILHPIRVMLKFDSEPKRIAAILHDVVEDTDATLDEIRAPFGNAIADAVDALTRRDGENYADFIERCGANEIARAVKWADLCDNMDLKRLPEVTDTDRKRVVKYRAARERLNAIAAAARSDETRNGAQPEGRQSGPAKTGHRPNTVTIVPHKGKV